MDRIIRRATLSDASAMLDIYRPVVEQTSTSFELSVPSVVDFRDRINGALHQHEWLVMTDEDACLGYAYAVPHKSREAYSRTVETSVYVAEAHHGRGVGLQLYEALFDSLKALGMHVAVAGITLPNDGSIALHRKMKFESVGVLREVGYKHGAWRDVSWWQRLV